MNNQESVESVVLHLSSFHSCAHTLAAEEYALCLHPFTPVNTPSHLVVALLDPICLLSMIRLHFL